MAFSVKKSMHKDQPPGWPRNCGCSCAWNARSGKCSLEIQLSTLSQHVSETEACLWGAASLSFWHSFSAWWSTPHRFPGVPQTASQRSSLSGTSWLFCYDHLHYLALDKSLGFLYDHWWQGGELEAVEPVEHLPFCAMPSKTLCCCILWLSHI